MRSGTSLYNSPTGLALPDSIATMPSRRFAIRRSWAKSAPASQATRSQGHGEYAVATSADPEAIPANIPAMEIVFAVTPRCESHDAEARAQPVSREAIGRRSVG